MGGLRAFAESSRLCRALAQPYFFKPSLMAKLPKQVSGNVSGHNFCYTVVVSTTGNYKTLRVHGLMKHWMTTQECKLQDLTNILAENGASYRSLELLSKPEWTTCSYGWSSPAMVNIISAHMPMLSRLSITLPNLPADCLTYINWVERCLHARKNASPVSQMPNLRHLQLHQHLNASWRTEQLVILKSTVGCGVAESLYDTIMEKKQGVPLDQLDIILEVTLNDFFARQYFEDIPGTTQVVMSCKAGETLTGRSPKTLTCDIPVLGQLVERRKRLEQVSGDRWTWAKCVGPFTWKRLRAGWPSPSKARLCVSNAATTYAVALHKCSLKPWEGPGRLLWPG